MCEYSNTAHKVRNAEKGDRLIVASVNQGCVGFADIAERDVSVCMVHGTELAFDESIKYYSNDGAKLFDTKQCVARFVELHPHMKTTTFSDALVIKGLPEPIQLVNLQEGQLAKVLQLPAPRTGEETGGKKAEVPPELAEV